MTIFFSNLKRILKKRINRIMIVAVPVILVLMVFNLNMNAVVSINIGVVDNDNTEFTKAFIKGLQEKSEVEIISEDTMKATIKNNHLAYGVVMDKGFTEAILNGEDVKLKTYRADDVDLTSAVKLYIENYISAARNIAKNTKNNKEVFYSSLRAYEKGTFKSETIVFGDKGGDGRKEKSALGLLGYAMLIIATFSTNLILEDKKNKTYIRMFASPLKNFNYMLQNIFSFLFIVLIQVYIAFKIMTGTFKAQLGASVENMFVLFVIYAATCVALALAIGSVSKNIKQASALGVLVNTLVAMLGGLFWPKELMPDILLTMGKFTPAYWLTDGIDKLLTSRSITSAAQDIGILLLFTVVFFMISSWGKVYVEDI
ncbi:ABC transporter permease [Clostridium estertheticum]|uniref:ABC transporter permease n=1 Tax=Clostridium estertheticum TaxID=238834 RepID=UPI0013E96200|nr:ABC transporter permease [Clostridium estertheticum]MBZ9685523.1 ABC transporter permease [Clostridium estertheticum]